MNTAMVMGIARHFLTIIGGYLISKMKLDPETIQAVIGAIATLIGCVWSIYAKAPFVPAEITITNTTNLSELKINPELYPLTPRPEFNEPREMRRRPPRFKDEPDVMYTGESFDIPSGIKPQPTQYNSGC